MTDDPRRRISTLEYQAKPSSDTMVRLPRLCLGCKSLFDSAWAGERVCPRCKGTTSWRNGASVSTSNFGQSSARSARKGSS